MSHLLPLSLDLRRLAVAVAGSGPKALARVTMITDAGAIRPTVYAPGADTGFRAAVEALGAVPVDRLPDDDDLAALRLLFVADIDPPVARALHDRAEALKVLVNVEDVVPLCAAQVPSILRRGDLTIAVSTAGASPSLAIALKAELARLIGPEWAARTAAIRKLRMALRGRGLAPAAVKAASDALIRDNGWLPLAAAPAPARHDTDTASVDPVAAEDGPRRAKA
ncbi:NAD(P)-dependent oxidoreductase [Tistrella bauzanensis]|jgi:precorrin-2 dehydrogenase/sirohydrochlorin ferrochelatase|uniref:precorrin-2 dehydrogenase n=1 Tax=Tistrella arctica TaxID=3133430 RepID=A0ABU9YD40_9PROT